MPCNLYGPNDNFSELDSHVIPGLISRMHNAKKENTLSFNIWGSGKPLREFMHVDDLASSILSFAQITATEIFFPFPCGRSTVVLRV